MILQTCIYMSLQILILMTNLDMHTNFMTDMHINNMTDMYINVIADIHINVSTWHELAIHVLLT